MDKVEKYNQIVNSLLQRQADIRKNREEVETQFIKDKDDSGIHHLLVNIGFSQRRRIYGPFIHIDVKSDGKVWIQHDGTDLPVADYLTEMGIPKEDIVLGFHPEELRQYTDFAIV